MSFSSLSSLSQSPHPNAVDLTQNASMHNAAAAPQGQPNPTSKTNVAQFATANRQAAQNSEFEGSEGDSLTDIFLKIKSEFPTLPPVLDQNNTGEMQYKFSSDDVGHEGQSLPSLEPASQAFPSSNLSLDPGAAVFKRKRKTHKVQNLNPPTPPNLIETSERPAKKIKKTDSEEPQEGNASLQADNEAPPQGDDCKSQMDILKNRIIKFLESKKPNQHLFKSWLDYTIQLSQFKFKNNKNEYIKCIEDSFKSFLSGEIYRKRLKRSLVAYRSLKRINLLEEHILPILSSELKKDLSELIQGEKLKYIQAMRKRADFEAAEEGEGESQISVECKAKKKLTDIGEEYVETYNEEPQEGEGYSQNEILKKNEVDDEDYEEVSFNSQTIKVKADKTGTTKKALEILKNRFPMKPEFKNIIYTISKKFDNIEFSSESKKEKCINCINRIFKEFLSERWKARFISALSMFYSQQKVNFLKEKIVPLLLPETGKILQEVVENYKPGGTTHLRYAVKKFKIELGDSSPPSSFEIRPSFLTSLLEIVVQYAKNIIAGQKPKGFRTSSYLIDISNIFSTLDDKKIQLLNAVLPKFSLEDLNILAEWIPEIKKPIDDEIARRAPQAPQ